VLRIPALAADLPWFLPGFAISVVIGYLVRHRAAWVPRSVAASRLGRRRLARDHRVGDVDTPPRGRVRGWGPGRGLRLLAGRPGVAQGHPGTRRHVSQYPAVHPVGRCPRTASTVAQEAVVVPPLLPSPRGQCRAACGGLHMAEPRQDLDPSAGRAGVGTSALCYNQFLKATAGGRQLAEKQNRRSGHTWGHRGILCGWRRRARPRGASGIRPGL